MSKSIVKITFLLVTAVLAALALVVVGVGAVSQNTNSSTTMTETQNTNSSTSNTQDTDGGVNEDLTGNYTGRVTMSGAHEMSGDATLNISGNTFTLEAGGMTHSGRIYAINTRRYVGAALYFNDMTDSVSQTPLAYSVRVRRGRTFSMTPVPGSRNRLNFTGRAAS